ncbi:ABC transporter substrate-binding protein [Mycolicibacterium sp. 050158]|uniref:ABC transporter substrate-binding protein n=1 Tax=Mycolicibacterium sp. 050158 TaxID=3090602 RepID=UPI00299D2E81|nr:ABC transporter substrate-binding protein [Mycolicibacterium sp. 050158]MDX1890957.1 ABC transporter substrate-binding protein [Mycolicibacterium sp. 050158]
MNLLRVGAAVPDPPFNGMTADGGLDVDLMNAIGGVLGVRVEIVAYSGADFDGIFDELAAGNYDCVASGTTVTPERRRVASFAPPYLVSGQSLAVNTARLPGVRSIDDLAGLTIGVQRGNTSQPIAEGLVAQGKAKAVRLYDYGDVRSAVSDLTSGGCDAVMKLGPVLTELVRSVPDVEVVQRGITREEIAIAANDDGTLARITAAQEQLDADGTLQELRRKWLGAPYRDQSLAAL